MGKKPNLDALDYLFEGGKDFRLSGALYEEKTGMPLPKEKRYLKSTSALANRAAEKGYVIVEVEEKASIEKIVYLKKRGKKL